MSNFGDSFAFLEVFWRRYANLYFMRLAQLRDKAFAAAVAKWPDLPKQRADLTDVPESVEARFGFPPRPQFEFLRVLRVLRVLSA